MDTEQDTSGFYMFDAELFYASGFVVSSLFELIKADKDKYQYPVYGWYWFDSNTEAREFFGLPILTIEQQ